MNDDPEVIAVVCEWVSKAEDDFAAAAKLLEVDGPAWIVGFHAQQAAEKYLKALLVMLGTPFAKGHDIGELVSLLPESRRPPLDAAASFELTRHAVASRYPEAREPTTEEARNALTVASRVRQFVRGCLPADSLRQP